MPVASTADGLWGWGRPYQEPDLDIPGMQLKITPAYKGRTTWDTNIDGPLILEPNGKTISYSVTSTAGNLTFELWGAGGGAGGFDGTYPGGIGGAGGYVSGVVAVPKDNTIFTVVTGQGGNVGLSNVSDEDAGTGGKGGGPGGHSGNPAGATATSGQGGGGGGYSSVTVGTTYYFLAGGGGGGGGGAYNVNASIAETSWWQLNAMGSKIGSDEDPSPYGSYYDSGSIPIKQIKPDTVNPEEYQRPSDGGGNGGGGGGWRQGVTSNVTYATHYPGFGGGVGQNYANTSSPLINSIVSEYPTTLDKLFKSNEDENPPRGRGYSREQRFPPGSLSATKFNGVYNGFGGNALLDTSYWGNPQANIGNGGNGRVIISSTYPFYNTSGYGKTVEDDSIVHHYPPGTNISSDPSFTIRAIGYGTYNSLVYYNTSSSSAAKYPIRIKNFETFANIQVGNYHYGEGGLGFRFTELAEDPNGDAAANGRGDLGGRGYLVYDSHDDATADSLRQILETDFTIEMWTKIEKYTASYSDSLPTQISWSGLNTNSRNYTPWAFGVNGSGQLTFWCDWNGQNSDTSYIASSLRVMVNVWTHIAVTWNNTTKQLQGYINGQRAFSRQWLPNTYFRYLNTSYSRFCIGHSQYAVSSNYYQGFIGLISNLRIQKNQVYTGESFTVPSGPLTADANTLLLALTNSNSYTTVGPTLVRRGGVFVSGDSPFNTPTKTHNLIADGKLSFRYPGTYTITPEKSINVPVKIWGAQGGGGGGGGYNGIDPNVDRGPGGPGGYTYGIMKLSANTTYDVIVGEGGCGDNGENTRSPYQHDIEGSGGYSERQYKAPGGGGAGSGIRFSGNSQPILVAGGGGGSQVTNFETRYYGILVRKKLGGAGGGDIGQGLPSSQTVNGNQNGLPGDRFGINQLDQYRNSTIYGAASGGNGGRGLYWGGFAGGRGFGNGGAAALYRTGQFYYNPVHVMTGGGGGGGYRGGNGGQEDTITWDFWLYGGPVSSYIISNGGGGGGCGYIEANCVTQIYETITGDTPKGPNDYDPDGQGAGNGGSIYGGAPGRIVIYP